MVIWDRTERLIPYGHLNSSYFKEINHETFLYKLLCKQGVLYHMKGLIKIIFHGLITTLDFLGYLLIILGASVVLFIYGIKVWYGY